MESIQKTAELRGADAVIHAGDFGFYDGESVDRVPLRELRLRVRHSTLSAEEKSAAKELDDAELRQYIRTRAESTSWPSGV